MDVMVGSAWSAVSGLLLIRFSMPPSRTGRASWPRSGLSTSRVEQSSSSTCLWPGRRDRRPPGPVSGGDYRARVEQHDLSVTRPPCTVAVPAAQVLPARIRMLAPQPAKYLTPDDHSQILERAGGHPGTEVGGPAAQHRVELVQQERQRQADVHPAN